MEKCGYCRRLLALFNKWFFLCFPLATSGHCLYNELHEHHLRNADIIFIQNLKLNAIARIWVSRKFPIVFWISLFPIEYLAGQVIFSIALAIGPQYRIQKKMSMKWISCKEPKLVLWQILLSTNFVIHRISCKKGSTLYSVQYVWNSLHILFHLSSQHLDVQI